MDSYGIYCETSRIIMGLANVSLALGLISQCRRLYRTKSTKSITLGLVAFLSLQRIITLNYGIAIHEWPTIAAGAMNLPIILLIAIGYWRFRGRGPVVVKSLAVSHTLSPQRASRTLVAQRRYAPPTLVLRATA